MGHHHTILVIAIAHSYMLCGFSDEVIFASFSIWFVWLYVGNKEYITQQTNEEMCEKGRILSIYIITGGRAANQTLCIVIQWQNRRQWAPPETQEVPSKHQETLFNCEGD